MNGESFSFPNYIDWRKQMNNSQVRIMSHLIAGYPNTEGMMAAAKGLVEGGTTYLEIQLPFSDPSADGPAIQKACSEVLSRGYRVSQGFESVRNLKMLYQNIPLFVMTYANLAFRNGVESFVRKAKESGVDGLIIPDLPFDHDESLNELCEKYGLSSVVVAFPSMSKERIEQLKALHRPYIYAALRKGITGEETTLDASVIEFLDSIRGESNIFGGFGISNENQVKILKPHVDAVVVGSAFVREITIATTDGPIAIEQAMKDKMSELIGF